MKIKEIIYNAKTGLTEEIEREQTLEEIESQLNNANQQKISELKQNLTATDYKAIKFAEGILTAEEFAETKAQRQAWRNEINQLEK